MAEIPEHLIKVSKTLNRLIGGDTDMTVCASLHHKKTNGSRLVRLLINTLDRIFWFDPDHCKQSYVYWRKEQQRKR